MILVAGMQRDAVVVCDNYPRVSGGGELKKRVGWVLVESNERWGCESIFSKQKCNNAGAAMYGYQGVSTRKKLSADWVSQQWVGARPPGGQRRCESVNVCVCVCMCAFPDGDGADNRTNDE